MKLQFLGAAGGVTGSCYVVETSSARFAVDCGMHQGNEDIEKRNWDTDVYRPKELDFILVTHAHIDHSGLIPRLVRKGYKGPIYCTKPTADLLEIMLADSAHIQEMEAMWLNKKRLRHGNAKRAESLYVGADAEAANKLFRPRDYNQPFEPAPGVRINFKDAGHILGSAFIEMWVGDNGDEGKIVFSGDLGRPDQLIVNDPSVIETADFLLVESTYGDRNHKDATTSREELAEAIAYSYRNREKVIIPAFAVERTQEVLYALYLLYKAGKLPADMPVFLDSPLAIKATEIFRQHPEYFDADAKGLLAKGENPFNLPNLRLTRTQQESAAINTYDGPAVIISASGMANAGRVKHHLRHNLWKGGASIVFVGFQARGTPGRQIVDGAHVIRILGEEVAVKARVYTIGGFSAHAGQSQILDWLAHFRNPAMQVFLVHGENSAQKTLATLIQERFGYKVRIPEYLEEFTLKLAPKAAEKPAVPEAAPELVKVGVVAEKKPEPRLDWELLLHEAEGNLGGLREKLASLAEKPWVDQKDLRTRLLRINTELLELLSDV